ncbi:MAG: response regulator transcription factor [Verrucomicrobia bacterium]|nr:response regulator transcription factor [Verrucomicrobiota bacterium]
MEKTTLLLADDHTIVRQGLRALLQQDDGIQVVGEAETGRQAVQLARKLLPEIVVMDIAMPMLNGLEATRQIVRDTPVTKVLILSCYNDGEYVRRATEAGASGYLLKQTAADDLLKAIREVQHGNAYFSPAVSKQLLESYRDNAVARVTGEKNVDSLTSRELEVLQLIAEGQANKQIAAELCLSIKTIEKHRQQLMNKLNIHDIAGLTRYAVARGVVETIQNFARFELEFA